METTFSSTSCNQSISPLQKNKNCYWHSKSRMLLALDASNSFIPLLIQFSSQQKQQLKQQKETNKTATAWGNLGFPCLYFCNGIFVSCIVMSKPTPRVSYFQHTEKCSFKCVQICNSTIQQSIMIEKDTVLLVQLDQLPDECQQS